MTEQMNSKHNELIEAYNSTMLAVYENTHERMLRCIVQGKPLTGVCERRSSPGGIAKTAALLAVTVGAGWGGVKYFESHGLTFGETASNEAVNIMADNYAPPPATVVSDADKAHPVSPVVAAIKAATKSRECAPSLKGAALAWCKKTQKHGG